MKKTDAWAAIKRIRQRMNDSGLKLRSRVQRLEASCGFGFSKLQARGDCPDNEIRRKKKFIW